jgi:hypothetical protein
MPHSRSGEDEWIVFCLASASRTGSCAAAPTCPVLLDTAPATGLRDSGVQAAVGHVVPIVGTEDFMGYGSLTNTTVSACDMDAFDAAWAWLIAGEDPHRPTVTEVSC